MHRPENLSEWLDYIERIHPSSIELGLDRVHAVLRRLDVRCAATVITVAGTNGKGSTCAMLEAVLVAAGYAVGQYCSPHLLRYNERVRLNGAAVDDTLLCRAFARVEASRQGVPLTYFEFGTLAAWVVFADAQPDVVILEVGLGGRLDAVNAFDADCAIVTSIAIDHAEYLGGTRELIGAEKAGVFRAGRPAIVADPNPPESLLAHARSLGADLRCLGRDFGYTRDGTQWTFHGRGPRREGLAAPALRGERQLRNASACLAALEALSDRIQVPPGALARGLSEVHCPGRFQVWPGSPPVVLDVAHNPEAAAELARNLADMGACRETFAVIGMLRDKDIEGVCAALKAHVDKWYAAALGGARGAPAETLQRAIHAVDPGADVSLFDSPLHAFDAAWEHAGGNDRIFVVGSFYTVAEVMAAREPA